MKKSKLAFFLFASILLVITYSVSLATDVYIGSIYSVGKKWNVLMTPFQTMPGSQRSPEMDNLWSVVKNDLEFSGYFSVITVQKIPALPNNPNFIDLGFMQTLNLDYYTQGAYSLAGNRLYLEADVMNPQTGLRVWGKRYRGNTELSREIAHRFSDEVVKNVTSYMGIANSKIAFIGKSGNSKELYMMDYDGENLVQLTHDNSITLSPSWSPDTTQIAFVSYRDGYPGIFVINTGTRKIRKIASFKGLNSAPSWSPDGRWIAAMLSKDGDEELYLLDPSGQGEPKRITFSRGIDTSPVWSPDGKQIAFVSSRSGGPQIYVMDADGSNVRRLTFQGGYNTCPSWSPRGDLVAYASQNGGGFNIYVVSINGQNPVQVSLGGESNEDPSWSPDGNHIIYSSGRGNSAQLYTFSLNGNGQKHLTKFPFGCSQPNWSR